MGELSRVYDMWKYSRVYDMWKYIQTLIVLITDDHSQAGSYYLSRPSQGLSAFCRPLVGRRG